MVVRPVQRPRDAAWHRDRRCLAALGLFLLAVYAFSASGRITSGDGEAMYQTTRALLTRRVLSIEPRPETAIGRGGRAYSKYGLGQTFVQAPLFAAGHLVARALDQENDRIERFAVSFTNPALTAALGAVFWLLMRLLGAGRGAATAGTLVFGLATLAWPYARADFSEPLQALTLLGAFCAMLRWRQRPDLWLAAVGGLGAGLSVITKAASTVLLAPLGLYFAWALLGYLRRAGLRVALAHACGAAVPLAACGLLQAALNVYRFGSVTEFGYGSEPSTGFTTPVLNGLQYLLLSSGKGLFWFAPPVVVGLAGLVWLGRRFPAEAMAAGGVFLAELLYYARWWAWHGDWCWGPRYLVVTVPFAMLGWTPLLAGWRRVASPIKALAGLTVAAGLAVSFLGTFIDYGNYYSVVADQIGRGVDVRDARLNPPFSPLLGHAWLAEASAYDAAVGFVRTPAGAASEPGSRRDREDNPFLGAYPWRGVRPDLVPEAPVRAIGFSPWFAALTERTPFILYWSGMVALWLALAAGYLGAMLWHAATARGSVVAENVPLAPRGAVAAG